MGCTLEMHPGSFSATTESLTASGCSPVRLAWILKNVVWRHMLLVRPCYEAVIAAGEGHVCFDEFN